MTDTQFFNGFQFNLFRNKKNYSRQFDRCSFHYFGRMLSGHGRICTGQMELHLNEGDIFYIPMGIPYRSFWSSENNNISFYSYGFSLMPTEVSSDFLLQKLDCTPEEIALFTELTRDLEVNPTSIGNLYRFLGAVLPKMTPVPKNETDRLLDAALDFMNANSCYTVADVARHCGVSECSLFIKFRKHFGKTPVQIRHQILCEKASKLLTTTDLPVEQISSRLGFSSSSYFRKILKEVTGKTPTQIRKSQQLL